MVISTTAICKQLTSYDEKIETIDPNMRLIAIIGCGSQGTDVRMGLISKKYGIVS